MNNRRRFLANAARPERGIEAKSGLAYRAPGEGGGSAVDQRFVFRSRPRAYAGAPRDRLKGDGRRRAG